MEQKTGIKGNVHYVGVNDRTKHLFEGMWPLPYGVSYNSYLIDDEMVALVDTVDICYFEVYLRTPMITGLSASPFSRKKACIPRI